MWLMQTEITPAWDIWLQLPADARIVSIVPQGDRLMLHYLSNEDNGQRRQRHLRAVIPNTKLGEADEWTFLFAARPQGGPHGQLWHFFERIEGAGAEKDLIPFGKTETGVTA
jgi:hypothetical protein